MAFVGDTPNAPANSDRMAGAAAPQPLKNLFRRGKSTAVNQRNVLPLSSVDRRNVRRGDTSLGNSTAEEE